MRVVFATITKTKSVKCSSVLAIHCVMLELKFMRNCISSVARVIFPADFPLLNSDLIVFYSACIFSCTLYKHLLNAAAWLQVVEALRADFSHRLKFYPVKFDGKQAGLRQCRRPLLCDCRNC